MRLSAQTYYPGRSFVHTCDARVKLPLLAAYSVTLFLVDTWAGMVWCVVACAVTLAASGIPSGRVLGLAVPAYVLGALLVAFNSFSFLQGGATALAPGGFSGALALVPPVTVAGSLSFVPGGFERGVFYALRVALLVLASLTVSLSTTSSDLADAFRAFIRPLRVLRVPVDDVAMVLSLALRFIPLAAEELVRVRNAQWSRGASFEEGSFPARVRAWSAVFVPLFVGLFRRADALAEAMDARCYGAAENCTSLARRSFAARSAFVLVAGLVICATLGCVL